MDNLRRNDRSSSRSRWGSLGSINRDRIGCFKCREYDHFAKDCLNMSQTEKGQIEEMHQMLDSEEQETVLTVIVADTNEGLIRTNVEERMDNLNS